MIRDHNYIKERLPHYWAGNLPDRENENIKTHLDGCVDCSEELALINKLKETEAPDPGEFFWKTLPGKVTASYRDNNHRSIWFRYVIRPVPATVFMLLVAVTAVLITPSMDPGERYYDPLFSDPFSVASIDYSILESGYINEITDRFSIKDNITGIVEDGYFDSSYHEELGYLSSDEMNNMSKALESQQKNGGVL
jgi:hypothetical protein